MRGSSLDQLPEISIIQLSKDKSKKAFYYEELVRQNLIRAMKDEVDPLNSDSETIQSFKDHLPLLKWDLEDKAPSSVTLLFFYKYRMYSSKFIYDLISKWLVPGKGMNIARYYGTDFKFDADPEERYIMIEVLLDIENEEELMTIKKNLPQLFKEVELGVASMDRGMRILEVKGMGMDDKIAQVQDLIVSLMNKKPKYFGRELVEEMQRFLVLSLSSFKKNHTHRHMVRLICWQYLFKKSLGYSKDPTHSKRLFRVKVMRMTLGMPEGPKKVLGLLVGVSYIRENESFGEHQVLRAIQNFIPSAKVLQESSLSYGKRGKETFLIYMELVKEHEDSFSREEVQLLKSGLVEELRGRVEQLMHPIFMPRNEEEIMRNILSLNKQLKSYGDIPQIIIQFDKQDETHVVFVVILLRVVKSEEGSVQELCEDRGFKYEFIPDRIKIVGRVKKGYSKEANVFYIRLEKQAFLRKDHSLDLYRARQLVLSELYRVFSDVRDYNGGMIAKENEIFNKFKKHMAKVGAYNEVLLENYFYSLTPVIIRSMVSVQLLETSFQIFLDLLEDEKPSNEGYVLKFSYQSHYIFSYIASKDSSFQNSIHEALLKLKLSRFQLISSFLQVEDAFYLGLVYQSDRVDERKRFCDILRNTLDLWQKRSFAYST